MRSSIRTFALGFAATAVLFAAAHAQNKAVSPSAPAARLVPSSGAHAAPAAAKPAPSPESAPRRSPTAVSSVPRSSTLGETRAPQSGARGESRMRENRTYGSEQGTASNRFPDFDGNREVVHLRVSNYYLPPSAPTAPAQEPPVTHTTGYETTVHYDDAVAAGREAQLPAAEYRPSPGSSLCPPPKRMTARDGCQR